MSHRIVARSGFVLLLPIMRFAMAVLLLGCSAVALNAQTTSATVVGTLTDSSGARIAGGTVLLKDLATGIVHSATTDSNGEYVVPDLKAAHYSVTFSMTGFRPFVMSDVELLVAQRATLDATLQVGEATQVVTVDTVAPMVDTTVSEVGQVVNTTTIEHVPLNGRSFWQLTNQVPGVTYAPGGQNTNTGGSTIRSSVVAVNINGGPPDQTGWMLDGAFITEMQSGGTMIQPDIDALQEFKVEGAMLPAEFGLTANMVNVHEVAEVSVQLLVVIAGDIVGNTKQEVSKCVARVNPGERKNARRVGAIDKSSTLVIKVSPELDAMTAVRVSAAETELKVPVLIGFRELVGRRAQVKSHSWST